MTRYVAAAAHARAIEYSKDQAIAVLLWRLMASAPSYSTYYYGLDEITKERYREKLQKLGGLADPYLERWKDDHTSIDWQLWPEVEYPDIYNFLLQPLACIQEKA